MNRYFILEVQQTASGDVNFITTEQYSLAKALSYYHTRYSIYLTSTAYPSVAISCLDSELNEIEHAIIPTLYNSEK